MTDRALKVGRHQLYEAHPLRPETRAWAEAKAAQLPPHMHSLPSFASNTQPYGQLAL